MIYSTATVPVNPAGEHPLTRDARLFLPPGVCTRCDLVIEGDGFLVRDATIGRPALRLPRA